MKDKLLSFILVVLASGISECHASSTQPPGNSPRKAPKRVRGNAVLNRAVKRVTNPYEFIKQESPATDARRELAKPYLEQHPEMVCGICEVNLSEDDTHANLWRCTLPACLKIQKGRKQCAWVSTCLTSVLRHQEDVLRIQDRRPPLWDYERTRAELEGEQRVIRSKPKQRHQNKFRMPKPRTFTSKQVTAFRQKVEEALSSGEDAALVGLINVAWQCTNERSTATPGGSPRGMEATAPGALVDNDTADDEEEDIPDAPHAEESEELEQPAAKRSGCIIS